MNTPIENGLTAGNSQPVKPLTKRTADFTSISKSLATYFVAANAVLTGVSRLFARTKFHPLDVIFVVTVQLALMKFGGLL